MRLGRSFHSLEKQSNPATGNLSRNKGNRMKYPSNISRTEMARIRQNHEIDWVWNDLELTSGWDDSLSQIFKANYLPACLEAFEHGISASSSLLTPISADKLDTNAKALRVYHVGARHLDCTPYVFIRNESLKHVDNWAFGLNKQLLAQPGDFVDFPARSYEHGLGGLQADIFMVHQSILISSGLGTNSFSHYTTSSTLVCQIGSTPMYYVQIKISANAAYAFVLSVLFEGNA